MRVLERVLLPLLFVSVASAEQLPNAAPPGGSPAPKAARPIVPDAEADALRARIGALLAEGPSAVPKALELLQSGDPAWRAAGLFVLGSAGARETAPTIVNILTNDRSPAVRLGAAQALGALGAREGVTALAGTITSDQNRDVRVRAIAALGRIDAPEVVTPIRQTLKAPRSEYEYQAAAVAAGQRGILAAEPELIAASTDLERPDHSRGAAVLALGLLGSVTARQTVLDLTRDPSPLVRFNAIAGLEEMRDAEGSARLVEILNEAGEENYIRIRAASAVATIGTPRGVAALRVTALGPNELMALHSLVALRQHEPVQARALAESLRQRAKDPFVIRMAARIASGQFLPWGQR